MYAVLYIAHFALQAVLRTEQGGQRRTAALFGDHTKKSFVIAVTPTAAALGVEIGMTAPQAVARCGTLLIRSPKPTAESDAHAALHAVGFTVSPWIEATAPGVCTIDLKGVEPTQRESSAAAAITQLEQLGFDAAAGIGPTPVVALYAAQEIFQRRHTTGTSQLVLSVTDPKSFLGPLPLAMAKPTSEMTAVLGGWGLHTLADLTALSRNDIGRRLGPAGLALWDRARGSEPRPLHLLSPDQTYSAALEFEDEIETLEPLLFILRRFLERITLELRTHGFVVGELVLTLSLADHKEHVRSFRLPDPTADLEILFRTLHTHLESLRTETPIVGIALEAQPTRPLVQQHGLFDAGLRDPHGFAETLARIVAIVGSDHVGTPKLEDTHRPDAIKIMPPSPVIPPAESPPLHRRLGLPVRRFRPPLPAQLELTNGKPTFLWTDEFNGAIAEIRGPWLNSGGWWEAELAWRRSEYDVTLATGGIYRLIRTDRQWFIEGEYD